MTTLDELLGSKKGTMHNGGFTTDYLKTTDDPFDAMKALDSYRWKMDDDHMDLFFHEVETPYGKVGQKARVKF